jgi:hypothetical protein
MRGGSTLALTTTHFYFSEKHQTTAGQLSDKYHIKNTHQNVSGELAQPRRYERLARSDVQLEQHLLVRIIIAKVTFPDALERILEAVAVYEIDDQNQVNVQLFTCLTWVQAVLEELGRQGALTELEGEGIQAKVFEYVERRGRRGDGVPARRGKSECQCWIYLRGEVAAEGLSVRWLNHCRLTIG